MNINDYHGITVSSYYLTDKDCYIIEIEYYDDVEDEEKSLIVDEFISEFLQMPQSEYAKHLMLKFDGFQGEDKTTTKFFDEESANNAVEWIKSVIIGLKLTC